MLNEKNKDILIKLLESILEVEIKDIIINNIERNSGNLKVRRKYLDILLFSGECLIDIEMNGRYKRFLHPRNLAYQSDNYLHNTLVGKEYNEETKIIQINLTYGIKNDKKVVRKYMVQDKERKKFVKNFIVIEYNMDRIMKFWYSNNRKEIEKYKYLIMLDLEGEELEKLAKIDRMVEKYKMYVEIINSDPNFQRRITEEDDRRLILNTEKNLARKSGYKKGVKENARKIAKKMLTANLNITKEEIAELTGLSLEEIESI